MSAAKVLTVDDSRSMRALLRMTLTNSGYEVAEAEDGEAALRWLERHDADLIITDINMPRLDGLGFIERLRSEGVHHVGKPILVLSTEYNEEKRARARAAGATGWVLKPFDPDRLIAAIKQVL